MTAQYKINLIYHIVSKVHHQINNTFVLETEPPTDNGSFQIKSQEFDFVTPALVESKSPLIDPSCKVLTKKGTHHLSSKIKVDQILFTLNFTSLNRRH